MQRSFITSKSSSTSLLSWMRMGLRFLLLPLIGITKCLIVTAAKFWDHQGLSIAVLVEYVLRFMTIIAPGWEHVLVIEMSGTLLDSSSGRDSMLLSYFWFAYTHLLSQEQQWLMMIFKESWQREFWSTQESYLYHSSLLHFINVVVLALTIQLVMKTFVDVGMVIMLTDLQQLFSKMKPP